MSETPAASVPGEHTGTTPSGRRRRKSFDAAKVRARVVDVIATVVRWVGTIAALILTAHVVLTVGGANPANVITQEVADWAGPLALGFQDLFTPADPVTAVFVNDGIAALFWLFVTSLAVRIVRAFG
jgi:hypothetical protein